MADMEGDETGVAGSAGSIRLNHASLRGQAVGSLTRYAINLHGRADQRWVDAYRAVERETDEHRRFHIDLKTGTITFACPNVEGPAFVFEMLERLERLLTLVERRAWGAAGSEVSGAPSRATAAP